MLLFSHTQHSVAGLAPCFLVIFPSQPPCGWFIIPLLSSSRMLEMLTIFCYSSEALFWRAPRSMTQGDFQDSANLLWMVQVQSSICWPHIVQGASQSFTLATASRSKGLSNSVSLSCCFSPLLCKRLWLSGAVSLTSGKSWSHQIRPEGELCSLEMWLF